MKIHIFGASGSGTTTLGKALAKQLNYRHLDADYYYWEKTTPPFHKKVPIELRNAAITKDFLAQPNCIISGSMVSWGEAWKCAFDLAVFLYLPPKIRLQRLQGREVERYGDLLKTDKTIAQNSKAFLEWAKQYDDSDFTGRSLAVHNQWITELTCPVLRIEGDTTVAERVKRVVQEIRTMFG